MWGEAVVRQRFPVREAEDQAVGKLANFIMQTQGVLHIRGDKHHRARVALSDFRNEGGTGCTR